MAFDPELIVLAGALAGGLAAWTGVGAGWSFALLAWAGVPLPGVLFVAKLTCAGTDASAWLGSVAAIKTPQWVPWCKRLLPGISAGCLGALCVLGLPSWASAGVWAAALLGAAGITIAAAPVGRPTRAGPIDPVRKPAARRTAVAHAWCSRLLGLYIGACGIGAGLIQLALARVAGRDPHDARTEQRVLGAGANLGAAGLLAVLTPVALGELAWPLWLLALSQAIGAGLVSLLLSRRKAKACATMTDSSLSDPPPR